MTIDELKRLLETGNEKAIRQGLEVKGFAECKNIDGLKSAPIAAIISTANTEETDFVDRKDLSLFGAILHDALFYEEYTFVWCEILKINRAKQQALPYKVLFYAKRNQTETTTE